jgi:hypothetical protein
LQCAGKAGVYAPWLFTVAALQREEQVALSLYTYTR